MGNGKQPGLLDEENVVENEFSSLAHHSRLVVRWGSMGAIIGRATHGKILNWKRVAARISPLT